jgi:hypothetical protein
VCASVSMCVSMYLVCVCLCCLDDLGCGSLLLFRSSVSAADCCCGLLELRSNIVLACAFAVLPSSACGVFVFTCGVFSSACRFLPSCCVTFPSTSRCSHSFSLFPPPFSLFALALAQDLFAEFIQPQGLHIFLLPRIIGLSRPETILADDELDDNRDAFLGIHRGNQHLTSLCLALSLDRERERTQNEHARTHAHTFSLYIKPISSNVRLR